MEIKIPLLTELPVLVQNKKDLDQELKVNIVTNLETHFWLTGKYYTNDEIIKKHDILQSDLKRLSKDINVTLKKRDLPEYPVDSFEVKVARLKEPDLDPQFVVACSLICDVLDKRSRAVKLKAVEMTTKRFNILLEDVKHRDYYSKRVQKAFGNTSESAKLSLSKNVEAGDLQSIKYYHEFSGEHDPQRELNINLLQVVSHFMEILVKHVSPKIVEAVAIEFEQKLQELG